MSPLLLKGKLCTSVKKLEETINPKEVKE